WQRTAFANLVQRDMGKAGNRPRNREWREGQELFHEYLLELRPHFVLVVGFGTWDSLPGKDRRKYIHTAPPCLAAAKRPWFLYDTGDRYAFVCGIRHTAR